MPRALTVHSQKHHRHTPAACDSHECVHYVEMMRLRRNLHDGLGPGLAGIMIRADILGELMTANSDAAEEMLRDLRREAAAFLTEFRRVLADPSPAELEGSGLAEAVATHAKRVERMTAGTLAIQVNVAAEVAETEWPAQVAAFWIVKEALTNVVKHAHATDCAVRLWVDDGLRLSIVDNGVGGAGLAARGVGLTSMRSRAAELGGWCEVGGGNTANGVGVTVTAFVPA